MSKRKLGNQAGMTQTTLIQSPRAAAPPARRRGGAFPLLTAVVLVLAAVLVVGDRVAARAAHDELHTQVAAQLAAHDVTYSSLDVAMDGFPFLIQVAEGRYDRITIDMTDVGLPDGEGHRVGLPSLHVVATGVTADTADLLRGDADVTAEQVTGTAVISYTTLETLVDYSRYRLSGVRFDTVDGALHATGTAVIGGQQLPIEAMADISVVDGQFQLALREASAVGIKLPAAARRYVDDLAQRSVTAALPTLPFGLKLDQLSVQQQGLAITATGHDVPLAQRSGA